LEQLRVDLLHLVNLLVLGSADVKAAAHQCLNFCFPLVARLQAKSCGSVNVFVIELNFV